MIASDFVPSLGGIQVHTLKLSQVLAARGVRVLVVTRGYKRLTREEWMGDVEVLRVGLGDAPLVVSTGTYITASLRLLWRRRSDIDVLHAHQMLSPMSIALLARRLWHVPVIINPHLSGPEGDVLQLTRSRRVTGAVRLAAARRYGDSFVAISTAIQRELREVGIPNDRIARIPNGVDVVNFRPANVGEKRALRAELGLSSHPLVVYAGRLASQKGLDVLLHAWPAVMARQPEARLAIIGDGEEYGALMAQAARLRIAGSVQFVGATADVAPWLRAADAFVLPSRAEGMSVSLLEAMACALPVVATAIGGTPEVLANGRNGRIVPAEDAAALGHGILEALDGQIACGAAARADVLAHYSVDHVADQLLELYGALRAESTEGLTPRQRRW